MYWIKIPTVLDKVQKTGQYKVRQYKYFELPYDIPLSVGESLILRMVSGRSTSWDRREDSIGSGTPIEFRIAAIKNLLICELDFESGRRDRLVKPHKVLILELASDESLKMFWAQTVFDHDPGQYTNEPAGLKPLDQGFVDHLFYC